MGQAWTRGKRRTDLGVVKSLGVVVALSMLAGAGVVDAPAADAKSSGKLTVQVGGLPAGTKPTGVLRGPGLSRRVTKTALVISNAKPGTYTLTLRKVIVKKRVGTVKKGATATPTQRKFKIRVKAGGKAKLIGIYGTIINPGVKSISKGAVIAVNGPAGNPSSIVLAGKVKLARGGILSIPASSLLPRGLLSNVDSVSINAGKTTVKVSAASIFAVAPAMNFDIPLTPIASAARTRAVSASCGGSTGVSPYRRIKNISFSGGWNTKRILWQDINVGVRGMVHFTAEAGVDATGGVGVECAIRASISANGMAGPIPVTAGIEGELTAYAGVGAKLNAGGSVRVSAGASTIGLPPAMVWRPEVKFNKAQFDFKADTFAEARAGIGVAVKAGLGNDHVASATIKAGSSLEFNAKPGSCSWDARFGEFSAQAKILGWEIGTPKTPGLFSANLWQGSCGATSDSGGNGGSGSGGEVPDGGQEPGEENETFGEARQLSAGATHSCGLLTDGTAVCWGGNIYASYFVPPSGTFDQLVTGGWHVCGLRTNGTATCWGLSDGQNLNDWIPPSETFTQIATGTLHACGLRPDRTVVCWGSDEDGSTSPPAGTFKQLTADGYQTCGLRTDGSAACWGDNAYGQSSPPPGAFKQLSAGGNHTCALRTDGTAACWGDNAFYGQSSAPAGTFKQITAGSFHTCGLRIDGTAVCWGSDFEGQSSPPSGTFSQLAAGKEHTCGLRPTGTVECWGVNFDGQSSPPSGPFLVP